MKNWHKIGLTLLVFVGLCVAGMLALWYVRQNVSDSLPYSYFIGTKIEAIERDMYVSLDHPLSPILLAKQVVGVPGDRISIFNGVVWINERAFGLIKETTRSGDSIAPIEEGIIPEGFVFVYAPHPLSYDSRYSDFGLIPFSQLREKLCPLF